MQDFSSYVGVLLGNRATREAAFRLHRRALDRDARQGRLADDPAPARRGAGRAARATSPGRSARLSRHSSDRRRQAGDGTNPRTNANGRRAARSHPRPGRRLAGRARQAQSAGGRGAAGRPLRGGADGGGGLPRRPTAVPAATDADASTARRPRAGAFTRYGRRRGAAARTRRSAGRRRRRGGRADAAGRGDGGGIVRPASMPGSACANERPPPRAADAPPPPGPGTTAKPRRATAAAQTTASRRGDRSGRQEGEKQSDKDVAREAWRRNPPTSASTESAPRC